MIKFWGGRMIVLAAVLLGGCQGTAVYVPEGALPRANFSLAVSDVNVVMEDDASQDQSRQWVANSLGDQVKNWFSLRFRPVGGAEVGHITIRHVMFKETTLPKEAGMKSVFTKQPAEQYDALVGLAFEVRDGNGFAQQSVTAQVQRTIVAMEGISLMERQALVQKLINQVLADVDREFVKNMRAFLPLMIQSEALPDL